MTSWERYQAWLCTVPELGLELDPSRMPLDEAALGALGSALGRAFEEMAALEQGAIANADEQRMVGHYWLRAPELAPTPELAKAIRAAQAEVQAFAARVHQGRLTPERAPRFKELLVVGIGGSALGPQLVARALGGPHDGLRSHFLDNTDPDGFDGVLASLGGVLAETLTVVISKSGTTPETRNGMLEVEAAYAREGLSMARHAVAVTGQSGALYEHSAEWLARFPMWDWVGGRTSVTSAVGLLPAALAGFDVEGLLEGARLMDAATRIRDARRNPAALLAACWHVAGEGRGTRAMVVLPYKDRLELFSRYLQQLVMESLGKEKDRNGQVVHQGLAVYGNKGSTDQHAYVQQLRDGLPNFFATFIGVRRERQLSHGHGEIEVEPGATAGDFLHGFLLGTRAALAEGGRPSLTITIPEADARSLGALIALYERAVGLYASMIDVNAYHQPGVEAGKKAAAAVLGLQRRVVAHLQAQKAGQTADEIAAALGADPETVWHLCEQLAANRRLVARRGDAPFGARYATG